MFLQLSSLKGYKPLLYWRNNLLLAKDEKLFISDLELCNLKFIVAMPSSWHFLYLRRSRLLCRAKRLEMGPACLLDDDIHCLLWHENSFWIVNLEDGSFRVESFFSSVKRPLSICFFDITSFDRGVYYGEYVSNPDMKSVNVFHRDTDGIWSIVFSFPAGTINHIHSLIADPFGETIYLLTGDYGSAASIWKASNNFSSVKRICAPGQDVRACWLAIRKNGIFYATDSHIDANNCMFLQPDGGQPSKPIALHRIPGSSIYFLPSSDDSNFVFFSTAVEPAPSSNWFLGLFSCTRGSGILSDNSYIYFWDLSQKPIPIYCARKDIFPFRLFQFGSFLFPSGVCPESNLVHAYGSALKGVDGTTIALKRSV